MNKKIKDLENEQRETVNNKNVLLVEILEKIKTSIDKIEVGENQKGKKKLVTRYSELYHQFPDPSDIEFPSKDSQSFDKYLTAIHSINNDYELNFEFAD